MPHTTTGNGPLAEPADRPARPRILYLHQHFATRRGTAGTRSYEFARRLVDAGYDVDLVAGRNQRSDLGSDDQRGSFVVDGVHVHVVDVPYGNHLGFTARIRAFLGYAFGSIFVARHLPRPDVVFATSTPLTVAIPGVIVSWWRRVPMVFEVRDIWPESATATGGLRSPLLIWVAEGLERLAYEAAVRVVALSDRMASRIAVSARVPTSKLRVVPIGADLELFAPGRDSDPSVLRSRYGLGDDFLAVFAGAHGRANGLNVLLDAAHHLTEGIRIVLIGDGGQKAGLRERAEREGLSNVLFVDPMPKTDLAGALREMQCGLMILDPLEVFETVLPNKFFDYASAGLPVLVNFPGEVADHVVDASAGIFVEAGDGRSIARALEELRRDDEARRAMGTRARRLATEFDRDLMAERFRRVIAEVVPIGAE